MASTIPSTTAEQFEPFVARDDLLAEVRPGHTVVVARKGQRVTPELLREAGVRPALLRRRVDEPSQHSPQGDLVAARETAEAVRAGLVEPANEVQRRGDDPSAVQVATIKSSDVGPVTRSSADTVPEVFPASEKRRTDADEDDNSPTTEPSERSAGPKPRTAKRPAPSQ
jgi:hypothetical protein